MSLTGDDPAFLSVGTEVSAKYKGAFCEAKIKKVNRCIKCRVTYKQGLGTATITDDQIKPGQQIRIGALIEAKYNDRKEFIEATINKIQDCSQYTVVFDDGDITTLRRSALCLKSGRHFAESETLDQLPLTHPEHFGYPVTGGRRGRRSRQNQDGSSEDDDDDGARGSNDSGSGCGGKDEPEVEPEIGKVVCVELSGDKKKKDNWFPGLIVSPNAQDTNKINVHEEYLVRSFRDSRYYTVPKKETTEFTKDLVAKVEHTILKTAVEKAILFLEKNELPNHWDKDVLFGCAVSSDNTDSEEGDESPSSDDEPREEKDHVVATLYKFMDDRGTPINQCPMIGNEDIDLYKLFRAVYKLGGYNRVTNQNQWKSITKRLGFQVQNNQTTRNAVKNSYKKYLHSFEDFYRKLGCTMVNHPRTNRAAKQRPGRSLIRDRDRTTTPNQEQVACIKMEKEEDEKKPAPMLDDEVIKKEKIKKEPTTPKEEEQAQVKVKKKEEPAAAAASAVATTTATVATAPAAVIAAAEDEASGQESDVNLDVAGEESSSSERSQRSMSRLTPSSSLSGKSKAAATVATAAVAKTKDQEALNKKKTNAAEGKKKSDAGNKKQEKRGEEKGRGPDEDSTKTRSRSKDDVGKGAKSSSETRETRAPSRESDKKGGGGGVGSVKPRRLTDDELKKRGRKKKDAEGEKGKSSAEERSVDYAPLYKGPVDVGDKLNVYYGPTHEKKVTYEAKVIDISKDGPEQLYLVHYTGWNNRYDEWIKCSRIAQNYTQSQGRLKRLKTVPRPQTPSSSKSRTAPNAGTSPASSHNSQNRRQRAQGDSSGASSNRDARKDEREATPTTRSMTPSPLISNVLRTKSPASTASNRSSARVTRNADSASSSDLGRRPRRSSGHADAIAARSETESEESDSLDSDASVSTQVTSRSTRVSRASQEKKNNNNSSINSNNRREARRRAESRMKIEDASDAEEKEVEEGPRRGRRIRKPVGKMVEVKSEPESDAEEQPKGRDFDLNQIRSELKGFDKAVKLEMPSTAESNVHDEREDEEDDEEQHQQQDVPPVGIKQEKTELDSASEKKVLTEAEEKRKVSKPDQPTVGGGPGTPTKRDAVKVESSQSESTEDIYEFKEPEPFEFEVRNKRDSGGSGGNSAEKQDKDKEKPKPQQQQQQQQQRAFEEDQKSPKKRTKTGLNATSITPVKVEPQKSSTESGGSPSDGQQQTSTADASKKKARKIFKKSDEAEEGGAESTEGEETAKQLFTYGNAAAYKRGKGNALASNSAPDGSSIAPASSTASSADSTIEMVVAGDESSAGGNKSPKKRQPKAFGVAAATAAKSNEVKREAAATTAAIPYVQDSTAEAKKKVRKIFGKKPEDSSAENAEARKELLPGNNNRGAAVEAATELKATDESSKRPVSEDEALARGAKKRQKVAPDEPVDAAKKKPQPTRKLAAKKPGGEAEGGEHRLAIGSESDETEEPHPPAKYFSQYSGPKSKAAAAAAAAAATANESSPQKSRTEAQQQAKEPLSKAFSLSGAGNATAGDATQSAEKREPSSTPIKPAETKPAAEPSKPLDFTPTVPHSLIVPAPLSARLPATASIEEKLSAAAVFRSKMKEAKKDEEPEVPLRKSAGKEILAKKTEKETPAKKTPLKSERDDSKTKLQQQQQQQQNSTEQVVVKKDPLTEIEVRKDPLLEVVRKRKDDELNLKLKRDREQSPLAKANSRPGIAMATTMTATTATTTTTVLPPVTKTYGGQRKEPPAPSKPEEVWKKAAAAMATASSPSFTTETTTPSSTSSAQPIKDYPGVRKETIVSKIVKSSIDRDSVDSTDSSDSERRLTIIDNEDFADDKQGNEPGDAAKASKTGASASAVSTIQFSGVAQQETMRNVETSQRHAQQMQHHQIIGTVVQAKSAKVEEDGENLNSLLCEEEIPGSPTPGGESVEQEPRSVASGSQQQQQQQQLQQLQQQQQNLIKTDLGSKAAVAFVASQLPLSTVPSSTPMTKSTIVTTMSSGGMQQSTSSSSSSNIHPVPVNIQHLNVQPVRQQQQHIIHPQLKPPQQPPMSAQLHHQPHHQPHHLAQQSQQHHLYQYQHQHHHQPMPMPAAAMALQQQQQQQRRESNEAAPVMENTPPTTPDSSVSNLSSSPRNERTGGSNSEDNSSGKIQHRDSSEAETEGKSVVGGGSGSGSNSDGRPSAIAVNPEIMTRGNPGVNAKTPPKRALNAESDGATSPKKGRKRKYSDVAGPSSGSSVGSATGKKSPRQAIGSRHPRHGSDSDDSAIESPNPVCPSSAQHPSGTGGSAATAAITNGGGMISSALAAAAIASASAHVANNTWNWNYTPRSKYVLLPELNPNWSSDERIDILNKKIIEARKSFAEEQAKLAKYEKHMKKIKRKRREEQKALERAMAAV